MRGRVLAAGLLVLFLGRPLAAGSARPLTINFIFSNDVAAYLEPCG